MAPRGAAFLKVPTAGGYLCGVGLNVCLCGLAQGWRNCRMLY